MLANGQGRRLEPHSSAQFSCTTRCFAVIRIWRPCYLSRFASIVAAKCPGKKGYYETPIFHWYADQLSVIYGNRYYIESAQRFPDAPRLTANQIEALDLFDALANDPSNYLDIEFKPGDIQLIHNHVILHDRTDYEDWAEPERKRHLLRLWLCPPNGRPLPPVFADRYGGTEIGNRGGIVLSGVTMNTPLEAC